MQTDPARSASPEFPIPVEEFLASALHDPQFGYYRTRAPAPGRTGDFATAPTLHPVLGRAIAAWIRSGGSQAPRSVIELGGGDGSLLAGVLAALGWWGRCSRHFHVVDTAVRMREVQRKRLAANRNVQWHETIESALDAAGGAALIYSNEFVDAFPCALLERTPEGWREVRVTRPACGIPIESLGPVVTNIRGVQASAIVDWPDAPLGQRVEVHAAYAEWLRGWVSAWKIGAMLTIDYGDTLPGLYRRRPRGTLRGYLHHTEVRGLDVYRNPGRQDLTADVNFTDLERWGQTLGLRPASRHTLRAFVHAMLPRETHDTDPLLRQLLDPAGAGGAFQVLEQLPPHAAAAPIK